MEYSDNRARLASQMLQILDERHMHRAMDTEGAIPGLSLLVQRAVGLDESSRLELKDTKTDFGRAVSPFEASGLLHASHGWTRTRRLIIGFWDAIQRAMKDGKKYPLQVLYVGTGPYATLTLPVAARFPKERLQVHAVDIHQDSLDMLDRVLRHFDLDDSFPTRICADATRIDWSKQLPVKPDIVITECMDRALLREPQVRIVENLNEHYGDDFSLVPNLVMVGARLCGEDFRVMKNFPFFYLDRSGVKTRGATYDKHKNIISKTFTWEDLPQDPGEEVRLSLQTAVSIGEGNMLSGSETSITTTVPLPVLPSGTKKARISYRLGCELNEIQVEPL